MQIAFTEYGSGKPIVLLHAFPLSGRMWKPNIESLVKENYRVITPDLPGFGKTSNFADVNSMRQMARNVAELTDNLKIEKAVVGSLSMGGYVAFIFFRLFRQKIAALVLCETNSASDSEEKQKLRYDTIEKDVARSRQNRIPFDELSVIENAGHYCNLEQPELFNSELLGFFYKK